MDQGTLANQFEPFFATKDVDKGTGLGLSTVYGIVKQNDGFINVYSEPDQGTTCRIYLPRYLAKTASLANKTSDKIDLDGTETILLVEDEPSTLRMTRMMLERMGYKVLAAGTPGEAIALAREHAGEIHLLMTDVVMPEMNGRQVETEFGGIIDLLCIDSIGDLVIVELKRNKTPREITSQILDHASWIKDLSNDDVTAATSGLRTTILDDSFKRFAYLPRTKPPGKSACLYSGRSSSLSISLSFFIA